MSAPNEFEHATGDPEMAEALMRQEGGDWDFSIHGTEAAKPFEFTVRQLVDDDVTITRNSGEGQFSTSGTAETFGALSVSGGRLEWEAEGTRGLANEAPVLMRPGRPLLCHIDGLEVTNVYVPTDRLEATARRVYGIEDVPIDFSSSRPLDEPRGRYFADLVEYTNTAVTTGAFSHELVRAALVRNLAVGMLECFPLVGDRRERTLSVARRERLFRGAVDFFRSHASLPITVDDAAASVGCSLGELHAAFRAHTMSTADQYLRRLRLAAAHEDLLVAAPGSLSVTDTANRWGFASVGAFVRRYRQAYGRSPLATLRS